MIEEIRRNLPIGFRKKLKNSTKLSYLIAPFYGYLMLPKFNGTALILGEGTQFFVHPDISAVDCLKEIYRNNVYEKIGKIEDDYVVFDVGANVGIFTVKVGKKLKNGIVISIEPSPQNIHILKKNIIFHKLSSKVIVISNAIGNSRRESNFMITSVAGLHRFAKAGDQNKDEKIEVIKVETVPLYDIINELKIEKIDFLKIDVEGAELEVLKGAKQGLEITKNIAIELHEKVEEIKYFLESKKFLVNIIGNILYAYNSII